MFRVDSMARPDYNTAMNPFPSLVLEVGCAIIRRGPELLIAQRKPEDHLGGYWEFPGGKKRKTETLENCLVREVEEELGIVIAPEKFFRKIEHRYPERILALHFYLCNWISGDPQRKECHDFCWIAPENLRDFQFPPADDEIIAELIANKSRYFHPF